MLAIDHNLTEDATIADELMQTDELTRKCKVIKMVVQDEDFTLEEALTIYKVSKEDYLKFRAKDFISSLKASVASEPVKVRTTDSLFMLEVIYTSIVGEFHPALNSTILRHFKKLSKDIETDKIKLPV